MNTHLKIYIDRLVNGKIENIDEELSPLLLETNDNFFRFEEPIKVSGSAYLAEEFLVLNLNISTSYKAPCKICLEDLDKVFEKEGLYFTEELSAIPSKVYDVSMQIRDTLFLEIPDFHECEGGCSMREELKKYLKEKHDGSSKK